MTSKKEVSNKTLFGLIVAVTVISIVSTYFIVDTVMNAEPAVYEEVSSGGEVSLTIEPTSENAEAEPSSSAGEVSLTIEEPEAGSESE